MSESVKAFIRSQRMQLRAVDEIVIARGIVEDLYDEIRPMWRIDTPMSLRDFRYEIETGKARYFGVRLIPGWIE